MMESVYTPRDERLPIVPIGDGEQDLENFRQSWRREIAQQHSANEHSDVSGTDSSREALSATLPPSVTAKPQPLSRQVDEDLALAEDRDDNLDRKTADTYDQEIQEATQDLRLYNSTGSSVHQRSDHSHDSTHADARSFPGLGRRLGTTETPVGKESEVLRQALELHLQAERLENSGQVPEAMLLYRKAARLDPNVEARAFEYRGAESEAIRSSAAAGDSSAASGASKSNIDDLCAHLCALQPIWQYTDTSTIGVSLGETRTQRTRIGDLPHEILIRILCMSLEHHHDVARLVRLREVCRRFYITCHMEDLWHDAANILWPQRCDATGRGHIEHRIASGPNDTLPWTSWQMMCVQRPRVLFHGVYISQTKYRRTGERTWETMYTPQHSVVFYRYLRFFMDGTLIALTTPEAPVIAVPKLKHPNTLDKHQGQLYTGRYSIEGDRLRYVAQKPMEGDKRAQRALIQVSVSLRIENRRRSYSTRLSWEHAFNEVLRDGEDPTQYVLSLDEMMPFVFSRIRSLKNSQGFSEIS
eukprot:m.169426 g.169426  ORF g.169426 m.169426 type:complete len:529 (+) comp18243_c0_seq6:277-1863(+)